MRDGSIADMQAKNNPIVRVLNENQFLKLMAERATSRQWRSVECIQTCVGSKKGLGKHVPIRFTMQLDYNDEKSIKQFLYDGKENKKL